MDEDPVPIDDTNVGASDVVEEIDDQKVDIEAPTIEKSNNEEANSSEKQNDVPQVEDSESVDDYFDPAKFTSLLGEELIACRLSWDPLLNALRELSKYVAKQQAKQSDTSGCMKDMSEKVEELKGELERSDAEKKNMAQAMDDMKAQLDQLGEQMNAKGDDPPRSHNDGGIENSEEHEVEEVVEAKTGNESARSTASSRTGRSMEDKHSDEQVLTKSAYVLPEDLEKAKAELLAAFESRLAELLASNHQNSSPFDSSDQLVADTAHDDSEASKPDADGAAKETVGASDDSLKDALNQMEELKKAFRDQFGRHDNRLQEHTDKLRKIDALLEASPVSPPPLKSNDSNRSLSRKNTPKSLNDDSKSRELVEAVSQDQTRLTAKMEELKKLLDELHQESVDHAGLLKTHGQDIDKLKRDNSSIRGSLDDIDMQLKFNADLQRNALETSDKGQNEMSSSDGKPANEVSGEEDGHESKTRTTSAAVAPSVPDLSFVFTKIADLRRSTEEDMGAAQENMEKMLVGIQDQQAQIDALRNGATFHEFHQLRLIESKLSLQKELLNRNQSYQEHIKPQLVEWRKELESVEDRLLRGLCTDELMQELEQLQRQQRRTLLSMTPLINTPLSIEEALRALLNEIQSLQEGVSTKSIPLRILQDANGKEKERVNDFIRKLKHLDEETDATLQVNKGTELRNDPLIKSLDKMREQIQHLWSLWHKNYNLRRRYSHRVTVENIDQLQQSNGAAGQESGATTSSALMPSHDDNSELIRELELRLVGATRRVQALEDDVEKLNEVNSVVLSEVDGLSNRPSTSPGKDARILGGLDTLKQDLDAELDKVKKAMEELQQQVSDGSTGGNSDGRMDTPTGVRNRQALVKDLYDHLVGGPSALSHDTKQLYDDFLNELIKKVGSAALNNAKGQQQKGSDNNGISSTIPPVANANYRVLLENFSRKMEDRLDDAKDLTAEEMARLKKEMADQMKARMDLALQDLRAELSLGIHIDNHESTALGTKPVMCIACSRPVPVSMTIKEAGALPDGYSDSLVPTNCYHHESNDDYTGYEQGDDDFVFRAGFKMPAYDRQKITLPFLGNRGRMLVNKTETTRKKRPMRTSSARNVDSVVRQAMDFDRPNRGRYR